MNQANNSDIEIPKEFTFSIFTPLGEEKFTLPIGNSMFFLGANGSGKTRLAVSIENSLGLHSQRISAHRALILNPNVESLSEERARNKLSTGHADSRNAANRKGNRYANNEATSLLNDFDQLIQTLYAEQLNTKIAAYDKARQHSNFIFDKDPLFDILKNIWEQLLPHRQLDISGSDIKVSIPNTSSSYSASEMSDGERAIFYLIGHVLCAEKNSVIIIDEPELHIHNSIILKLWDKLESTRQDCSFIFISHDLKFIASRLGQKFIIDNYDGNNIWTIKNVPEDTGFSEEKVTEILGSRTPILFVEGVNHSLDIAVYRACFPDWTIMAKGSCQDVIHAVSTFRNNPTLTRITCAGIVDADARSSDEIKHLESLGIGVLEVSEIENIFMLPEVAKAIAQHESLEEPELTQKIESMNNAIITHIQDASNLERAVVSYCRRIIDQELKSINLSTSDSVEELKSLYEAKIIKLNISTMADRRRNEIKQYIDKKDIPGLLSVYDNKGLLSVISHIKPTKLDTFKAWIIRVLGDKTKPAIAAIIKTKLPNISAW